MVSLRLIIRHFLLFLEENPNDGERRRDVEHNVFECYSILYSTSDDESEKRACVEAFHALFPQSRFNVESPNPLPTITPESFRHFVDEKLSQLRTLCSDIQMEKNHAYPCLLHCRMKAKAKSNRRGSV